MRLIEAKDFSVIVVVVCVMYLMISVLTNVQDLNDEYTYEYIDEKEIPIPDLKPANGNINADREIKPKTPITSIANQDKTISDLKNSSQNSLDHNIKPALQDCFIVIFIPSMAKSANLRKELRTRWLNRSMWREEEFQGIEQVYLNFKLMFVLGKHQDKEYSKELLEEVDANRDMFLTEFEESKATLKDKLLWALRESVKLYNYTYFVKVDHDTLIDLPNLIKGSITSPKDNLYTGYCNKMLLGSAYKRTFRYCLGGGYIFSRDLVEKIALLEDKETNVEIFPEDGYAGYLAWMVKKRYDLKGNIPQRFGGWRLKIYTKNVIKFTRYFYHWLKNHHKLERMFQCRIKANKTECPSLQYVFENGESKECTCDKSDVEAGEGKN